MSAERTAGKSADSDPASLVAELLGTLVLVFFAVGSAVLAGEFIGSLGIALAFGFTLVALAYVLGPVSGAQLNPAVTLGMLLAGRMTPRAAVGYWVAQLVGAIVGAALLFLVAHQVPGLKTGEAFGSNGYGHRSAVGLTIAGSFVVEVMLAALLVFVYLSVTRKVTLGSLDGLPVGLTLAAVSLIGIPLTGASLNPARSIGPALFAGGDALIQLWLFVLAPLVGAAIAVLAHRFTHERPEAWFQDIPWLSEKLGRSGGSGGSRKAGKPGGADARASE
ncbi:MIP/aquaporin family protein [Streptomyces profundus]|uniref:MIP/aquaporin family protein n=1 Tax=Streptomyces profundus TaxID=2867410 RepID=UPI001D15FAB1|nr:aquaporin [Streptomyces sp. MA3_2.13]UED88199.1 aquaporin [Streptomyces sp. MA3_2.13]